MLRIFARAFIAALLLSAPAAHAGAWPDRPVTLIVPYAPGGLTDVMARLTAEVLREKFHQPFIIQNEAGAGGIIGTASAARAKPDGYTLFFGPIALLTLSPLTSKVNYDPEKDFMPVSIVASTPFVVTINDSFPATTLAEFIAEVKKKPGAYSYASAGVGSTTQAASLLFLKSAGLDMVHIPYRGVAPAFTDLMAGVVQMTSASPVELKPHLSNPKIRPLGISSKERSRHMPNVPPISDTLSSPYVATYNGLMAPKETPSDIVNAISAAVVAAVKTKEFSDKLVNIGFEPSGSTPEEMAKEITADAQRWRTVAADLAPPKSQ